MKALLSFAAGLLVLSRFAPAQVNTSSGSAANLAIGQKVVTSMGSSGTTQFWYSIATKTNRSYCAETGQAESVGVLGLPDRFEDSNLDVFRADATTLLVHNDDTAEEPGNQSFSRACWISGANEVAYIRVTPFGQTPVTEYMTLRVVETTLFCPWFFIAGDYNAFSFLRNTADTPRTIRVIWRGLTGAVGATLNFLVPANGTLILNAKDFLDPGVFSNGSIEIAHAGSPDQIVGSTTTLSGTTGLSFDAPFTPRRPW